MTEDDAATANIRSVVEDRGEKAPPPDRQLIEDLVVANRILDAHGVVDAFGHVSTRHDKASDRFLLSRNLAPAQVTEADLVEFHLDGTPVDANGRPVYLERFIHGEIYKFRPDVSAIVHSHAHSLIPFGVARGAALRAIWHMSGFLGADVPVFEIRETAGDATDLLIRSNELGTALARSLGDASVVLMRGHGATVVGPNLRLCVFRSVYTQLNAELQLRAATLGEVNFLTAGESDATARSVGSQVDRAWNMWHAAVQDK